MKAAQRKRLPSSAFVYPPGSRVGGKRGKYPIHTKKNARAALAYAARRDTAGSYATVERRVRARYGNAIKTKRSR